MLIFPKPDIIRPMPSEESNGIDVPIIINAPRAIVKAVPKANMNSREDAWLAKVGLPYHSPHKFRHGHVHYGQAHSKTQEDYKAISQNVMHSTTGITDQFYSNVDDETKKNLIDSMFGKEQNKELSDQDYEEFCQFLEWKKLKKK